MGGSIHVCKPVLLGKKLYLDNHFSHPANRCTCLVRGGGGVYGD